MGDLSQWERRGKEYVKVKWTQLTFDWSDMSDDDDFDAEGVGD